MKTIALLLFLVGQCVLAPSLSLHAQELSTFATAAEVEPAAGDHSITVGEYTVFLKTLAAREGKLQSLYNDRLQNQIDRICTGDHFDYQVREGTDQNILFKGLLDEEFACYYDWVKHRDEAQVAATSATAIKYEKAESSQLFSCMAR